LLVGRLRPSLYLVIWAGIALLLAEILTLTGSQATLARSLSFVGPLTLVYQFMCLSAWWVCRSHPLGTTPPVRLAISLLVATAQASGLWLVAAMAWAMLLSRMTGVPLDRALLTRDLLVLLVAGIALYAESIVAHYALLAFESARTAERRVLETQVTAREAELRALRAQLNPHFLFNSLNSISALTGPDPEAARRMCQLLGDFLRTSLSLGVRERVAFAEELALAERYLSIEQVRFGDRLGFEKHVEAGAERCQVPPLLIQPLIENAVKHGVADRIEGGTVRIEARCVEGTLEVAVENPRDPEAPPRRGAGLGLENVRRRLEALDPRFSRVDVESEPERFRVVLRLPAVVDGEGGPDGR
jgi:sensor histidine kinase YesM